MNLSRTNEQPYERWIVSTVLLLFITAFIIGNGYAKLPITVETLRKVLANFLQLTIHLLIIRAFIFLFRRKFPTINQFAIRFFVNVLFSSAAGILLSMVLNNIQLLINVGQIYGPVESFTLYIGPPTFFSILMIAGYELAYHLTALSRAEMEKEALMKEHLQSQLDSLKNQVNPHFLFNSLNTLVSLISINPKKAERFTEELAAVYRYLLVSNQKALIPLQQELAFLHSYVHLLETRYGDAISIKINVEDSLQNHELPPLTLQLLVENAIKHNSIFDSSPLVIDIHTRTVKTRSNEQPWIVVKNNLQPKVSSVVSNKLGLTNIAAKYMLLQQSELYISDSDGFFTVELPLLKPKFL